MWRSPSAKEKVRFYSLYCKLFLHVCTHIDIFRLVNTHKLCQVHVNFMCKLIRVTTRVGFILTGRVISDLFDYDRCLLSSVAATSTYAMLHKCLPYGGHCLSFTN